MELKSSNKGVLQRIDLQLKALEKIEGKVGWFSSSHYEDGTPVAYVAAIQELGSTANSIPPRPFMRPTAIERKQEWANIAAAGAKAAIIGQSTAADVMEALTLRAEADVATTISRLVAPPLSPITIELRAMKEKNPGLIITGKIVGEAAARVNSPGYVPPTGISTKPLVDSRHMIDTLNHTVEEA